MATFSEMVDGMVTELLRPDLRTSIATYLNQTIRELHFKPQVAAPILFDANRIELQKVASADGPYVWTIPNAACFAVLESIYLEDIGVYAVEKTPKIAYERGLNLADDYYWYRAGSDIAISNVVSGWTIDISYWAYPRALPYYPLATRLVTYNLETAAYTLIAGGGAPSESELDLCTNWLLDRWPDALREGIRSKVWRRLGEESRARMSYSAYVEHRTMLWNTEPNSMVGI